MVVSTYRKPQKKKKVNKSAKKKKTKKKREIEGTPWFELRLSDS